jgi:hypothetical protein
LSTGSGGDNRPVRRALLLLAGTAAVIAVVISTRLGPGPPHLPTVPGPGVSTAGVPADPSAPAPTLSPTGAPPSSPPPEGGDDNGGPDG